ncbi:MAG: hypothetical protein K8R46_06085 [Pirellulales bacterium]|nr:hypothetical protein [Pirellulales bacterium]
MNHVATSNTDLGTIVPEKLKKKYRLSKIKLWIIVIFWISIAIYSYLATFFGYKYANLGDMSFVLTLASQIFTMIYAIPDVGEIRKRMFRVGTLPFWIVVCFSAHIISFGGSAFYHYLTISKVEGRADLATPQQVQLLHNVQKKITFNTRGYINYLEGLEEYYKGKKSDSIDGYDASSTGGRGDRAKLLENVVSELSNELKWTRKQFPEEDIDKLTSSDIELSQFTSHANVISSTISHPESQIKELARAQKLRMELSRNKPPFDYGYSDAVPKPAIARQKIKDHIVNYPFIKIVVPYEQLGSAIGRIESLGDLFSLKILDEGDYKSKYSSAGGLFAATVIEISMLIVNLFLVIQSRNIKAIYKRLDRTPIVDTAYDVTLDAIARFIPFTQKAGKIDPPTYIAVLSIGRNYIDRHQQINQRLICTELSAKPIKEESNTGFLKKIWTQVGLGYEAIYFKLDDEWVKTLAQHKEYTNDDYNQELIFLTDGNQNEWGYAIVSMARKLLDYMERTGEHLVIDGEHWVDFGDFAEWLSKIEKIAGVRGYRFPNIETDVNSITWEQLREDTQEDTPN